MNPSFLAGTMLNTHRTSSLLVRCLAFGAIVTALIIMTTSHERTTFFTVSVEAKWTHTPSSEYFVIANAIGCAYTFLLLFFPMSALTMILDTVMTMLLTSSMSAAMAIAYVGKKGDSQAGWLPICRQVPKYCHHVKGALVAEFIAVILYMLILCYSIWNRCYKTPSSD